MNLTIVAIIISSAAFITSLFAANWLNQRHVEKLMEQFGQKYDAKLETITVLIKASEQNMHTRFESVDHRFDEVDRRFDETDKKLEKLDGRLSQVEDILFKPVLSGTR